MSACTYKCLMNVINLGNSIIGVSILAMPYCFRKCGILLSILLIIGSGYLVKIACHLLLKGAIMARRRNYEFLAFHTLGSSGKLIVEIGIIGFLIGVCIAFFVVIGDLGPPLFSKYLALDNTPQLRTGVLMFLGLFVALPLGCLRKVDSLTSFSALSIAFYGCLILKILSEASPRLVDNEWWYKVNWWQADGLLPSLPIFSMALSCQTQLFEFFDTLSEPSTKRMMSVVSGAVHLCSIVYILVGGLGYIAFCDSYITGNVLVFLTPSMMTEFIKIGFVVTLVISYPLCLFPCRSSLHSLLFKQGLGHHDIATDFIPHHRFYFLTIFLVAVTVGIAIMLPDIEFVLGLIGSTIGTLICLIVPAYMFAYDTNKNTVEKRQAQAVLLIGVFILFACTYSTFSERNMPPPPQLHNEGNVENIQHFIVTKQPEALVTVSVSSQASQVQIKDVSEEKRQEPPIPQDPERKVELEKKNQPIELDPQALQKEDKELLKDNVKPSTAANVIDASLKEKQEQLLQKLQEQQEEQKLIIEQQKKLLEELKLHKESHDEQLKHADLPQSENLKDIPVKKDIEIIGQTHELRRNENADKTRVEHQSVTKDLNLLETKKLNKDLKNVHQNVKQRSSNSSAHLHQQPLAVTNDVSKVNVYNAYIKSTLSPQLLVRSNDTVILAKSNSYLMNKSMPVKKIKVYSEKNKDVLQADVKHKDIAGNVLKAGVEFGVNEQQLVANEQPQVELSAKHKSVLGDLSVQINSEKFATSEQHKLAETINKKPVPSKELLRKNETEKLIENNKNEIR